MFAVQRDDGQRGRQLIGVRLSQAAHHFIGHGLCFDGIGLAFAFPLCPLAA
jgi:hypothetical protein